MLVWCGTDIKKEWENVMAVSLPGHNETVVERLKDINGSVCVVIIINQIVEIDEK